MTNPKLLTKRSFLAERFQAATDDEKVTLWNHFSTWHNMNPWRLILENRCYNWKAHYGEAGYVPFLQGAMDSGRFDVDHAWVRMGDKPKTSSSPVELMTKAGIAAMIRFYIKSENHPLWEILLPTMRDRVLFATLRR